MHKPFLSRLSVLAAGPTLAMFLLAGCGGGSEPVAPTVAPNAPLAPTASATETAVSRRALGRLAELGASSFRISSYLTSTPSY